MIGNMQVDYIIITTMSQEYEFMILLKTITRFSKEIMVITGIDSISKEDIRTISPFSPGPYLISVLSFPHPRVNCFCNGITGTLADRL